jgi:hypothetical protein
MFNQRIGQHDRDFLVADNRLELMAPQALKTRTTPEDLAAAYKATNIRDDG